MKCNKRAILSSTNESYKQKQLSSMAIVFNNSQFFTSKVPLSASEKQSFPISIVSSAAKPFSIKSFTFFNEPSLTCSSFRLGNPVKSRVTSPSSLQQLASNVKHSTPSGGLTSSFRLLTSTCDFHTRHTTPTIVVLIPTRSVIITITISHSSLFLFSNSF